MLASTIKTNNRWRASASLIIVTPAAVAGEDFKVSCKPIGKWQ